MSRMLARSGIAATLLFVFATLSSGQYTGEVAGAVTDSTGAVVVGAELRLTNDATGAAWAGAANEAGQFRFSRLPPGTYSLTARSKGFADTRITGIAVEVNRISRVDVAMQVAATSQEVNVVASAQLLDFDSSAKGQIITGAQMQNLPLQTRNPLALMTLTPGVTAPGGGASFNRLGANGSVLSSNFTINGGTRAGAGGYHEYLVDGISVTNRSDGSIGGLPPSESIQEFRVQSGGMSAEFGHTVGGVVNYVTKGGGNQFHGRAFYSHRSSATNTRIALPSVTDKPPNIFNMGGGSASGPVLRNRTFFLFNYEYQSWVRKEPRTETIPTRLMGTGDFSEFPDPVFDPASGTRAADRLQFPGNRIPASRFNQFGKKIIDLFPDPTLNTLASNVLGTRRIFQRTQQYAGRLDHNFSDKSRAFFRAIWVDPDADQEWALGDVDQQSGSNDIPSMSYAANYNRTLTPAVVWNATAGYTRIRRTQADFSGNKVGTSFFGHTITPPETSPLANVGPGARFDIYRGIGYGNATNEINELIQLNQSVLWARGRHTLRFGADLRRYMVSGFVGGGGAPNGVFTFNAAVTGNGTARTGNSAASALLGMPNAVVISRTPALRMSNSAHALYLQDDWRLAPNLTLNLGLRWDGEGPLSEKHDRVGFFDPAAQNSIVQRPGVFRYAGLNGAPREITSGDRNNVSPRIGFAWSLGGSRRTVVRGAFATYYSPISSTGFYGAAPGFEITFQPAAPDATSPALILGPNYVLPQARGPLGDAAALGQAMTETYARVIKRPAVHQWNFGIQREVMPNTLLEVLYTANRGTHLMASRNINLPPQGLIEEAIAQTASTGVPGAALAFLNTQVANPLFGLVPGSLGNRTVTRSRASVPFPHYTNINSLFNDRDSIYHAMQATLQRRLSGDLNFMATYTFSKLIDNVAAQSSDDSNVGTVQNPYNLRDARGVSAYDRTHVVTANMLYELPFGKGKRYIEQGPLAKVVGGFRLLSVVSINSGPPIAVTQSAANGLGVGGARPDVISDSMAASRSIRGTVAANANVRWASASAFAAVNGRFGSSPVRDSRLRGPGFWSLDFGLMRDFRVYERLVIRFRGETFNALNHTNLRMPTQNISAPGFGEINQSWDARIFQLGMEVRF